MGENPLGDVMAIDVEQVANQHWFAGLAGAVISLFIKRTPGETALTKGAGVLSGWACAFYFAPPLVTKFVLPPSSAAAMSFAVGMFGMLVVASAGSFMGAMTKDDWLALWPFKKGAQ